MFVLAVYGCHWGPPQANSHVNGGISVGSATTLGACQSACQNTSGCIGIDISGANCYKIFSGSVVYVASVTHYDYICPS